MDIRPLDDTRCFLAESPVWDVEEQALYWIDGLDPALYRHDWASGTTRQWTLPASGVGSLALRRGGGLLLAMDQGLYTFDLDSGEARPVGEPFAGRDRVRFNDGKVDPAGRFIVGGMDGGVDDGAVSEPISHMIAVGADFSVTTLLDGVGCLNGPCFSPDGRTLYLAGRGDLTTIEAFDYDPATGALCNGRVIIEGVAPDGATVDADGFLWSTQFGAGEVLRLTPRGEVVDRILLPGQLTASVMFGGPDLDLLFVTTMGRPFWGVEPTEPDAGAVFVIEGSGFHGLPEHRFAG